MQSMMGRTIRFCALRMAVAMMVLATGLAQAQPIELLPNPGFEKINEKMIPLNLGSQNGGEFLSISEARTGDRAVRLVERPHEWGFSVFITPNLFSYPNDDILRIKVAKSGIYRASVWARGKGELRLGVTQYPSILGSKLSDPVALTKDWQRIQLKFHADAPDLLAVNLIFRLKGKGAIADIDDASFTFDPAENPGIEPFARIPERELVLRVEGRDVEAVDLCVNEQPVAIKDGRARVTIREGLVALALRAEAPRAGRADARPCVRVRVEGHPETDGRWRASTVETDTWKSVGFNDRRWTMAGEDDEGYLWSPEWTNLAPAGAKEVHFRQVLLWNETHTGPNRCILPPAHEWGVSRGGIGNLTLALYSPLPDSLADYEFVLEVPDDFELFGKLGDYYMRYVYNQKPDRIVEERFTRDGARWRRYRIFHPQSHVAGDTGPYNIFTRYSELPLRLDKGAEEETTEFRYRRQANGNFTELAQRIPVRILPPVNGRQPKRFMISAYVGMPLGYSALSPEHMDAFVKQIAAAGWTHVSVSVSCPGYQGWGDEWLAYQQRYLALCRRHGIQSILWPWHSFPITGAYAKNIMPTTLLDWVEKTPGAKARTFNDTPEEAKCKNMFCPTYVANEGAEDFRRIVKGIWAEMLKNIGDTDIIWTDDERHIFSPDGAGSYCFCDRCKEEFRAFAKLPADADLSDESIFKNYNKQWRLFYAQRWFGGVHAQLKRVANELGKQYMVYTWNGHNDLWRALRGNCDIAFPGMPGTNVADARMQKHTDHAMAFYREAMGLDRVQGQIFAMIRPSVRKNGWDTGRIISRDGLVDAKSWKSQLLRMAATLQGGVDLGENPIDYRAGSHYWVGEATRIIATFEDLFYDGERADALAASDQIAYPNLLVLRKGDERLVLLFNEGEQDLAVTLKNLELKPGQRARVFESAAWTDAAELTLTVPARDAVAVEVR